MCTWLDQHGFDPVSNRRRLQTAAIRYVFNIVYFLWTIVNYVRLSYNKIKVEFIIFIFKTSMVHHTFRTSTECTAHRTLRTTTVHRTAYNPKPSPASWIRFVNFNMHYSCFNCHGTSRITILSRLNHTQPPTSFTHLLHTTTHLSRPVSVCMDPHWTSMLTYHWFKWTSILAYGHPTVSLTHACSTCLLGWFTRTRLTSYAFPTCDSKKTQFSTS